MIFILIFIVVIIVIIQSAVCDVWGQVEYVEGYEPFVLAAREGLGSFDERFAGYGYDKVSSSAIGRL